VLWLHHSEPLPPEAVVSRCGLPPSSCPTGRLRCWDTMARYDHTSDSTNWATPGDLFNRLNDEFCFDLDAAASKLNNKCPYYLDREIDSLSIPSWQNPHHVRDQEGNLTSILSPRRSIFLNPPYGKEVKAWMRKAYEQSRPQTALGPTIVCLINACTDTKWWRDYVWKAQEVRFITGRPKFVRDDGHTGPSPKGAAICIFTPWSSGPPKVELW
jgi:phage N-6-adenine-methyltransferase